MLVKVKVSQSSRTVVMLLMNFLEQTLTGKEVSF